VVPELGRKVAEQIFELRELRAKVPEQIFEPREPPAKVRAAIFELQGPIVELREPRRYRRFAAAFAREERRLRPSSSASPSAPSTLANLGRDTGAAHPHPLSSDPPSAFCDAVFSHVPATHICPSWQAVPH
jgi:hypothetical protein